MDPHFYFTVTFKTGLWAHKNRRTKFDPYVDDFGVKYFTKDDAHDLLDYLKIPMQFQQIGRVATTSH